MVKDVIIGINESGADVPESPDPGISELFLDTYVLALYGGVITMHNLSLELYLSVGEYLNEALRRGFVDFDDIHNIELFEALRANVWHFSAAKQYQQNRTILQSFVAPLEEISFEEFKPVADQILANYNQNWLRTEWNTAMAESQAAREWNNLINDDQVEMIEYQTQEDGRVRHEHAMLNGAIYPKGHSFWNSYFPPNGFNCRCFTVSHDNEAKQKTIKNPPEFGTPEMPKVFDTNPAKDRIIFPNSHPYFRVAQGDKVFREANYGLPII